MEGTMLRCLECLARAHDTTAEEPETYDSEWVYTYRQAYEADAEVTPPIYDADDVQAFAQPGGEALQADDDDSADSALES